MDHSSKTTQASTLKLTRLVLPLLSSWTIPKMGQVIAPDGAAALFERGGPQQTAKRDLYICRPNISSQQLNSLYLGTTLVQELAIRLHSRRYFRFWTRFLRKYVYFRVVRLDLTPVPLQIWKSWAGLGTQVCRGIWEKLVLHVWLGWLMHCMIVSFLITLANETY